MAKVRVRTKRNYDWKKDTTFSKTDSPSMTDTSQYMPLKTLLARYGGGSEISVLQPQYFVKEGEIDVLKEIDRYITPDDVKKMDKVELQMYKRKVKRQITELQRQIDAQTIADAPEVTEEQPNTENTEQVE